MKNKLGTMDLILLLIGVFLAVFTSVMIVIFCITGSTPDTLITCVFGICGVEGGVMGWIKTSKNKLQKLKSQRETCNNFANNSNYTSNICEENADFEQITEFLEGENELEEETFE